MQLRDALGAAEGITETVKISIRLSVTKLLFNSPDRARQRYLMALAAANLLAANLKASRFRASRLCLESSAILQGSEQ